MTQQAINSLALYKGNDPSTIERALLFQNKSVVNELMSYFGVNSKQALAVRLSLGQ